MTEEEIIQALRAAAGQRRPVELAELLGQLVQSAPRTESVLARKRWYEHEQ